MRDCRNGRINRVISKDLSGMISPWISSGKGLKMAVSKSKSQKITITISNDNGKIDFKEHPTGFQLMAAYIILQEVLDFHFTGPEQARLTLEVYEKIETVEEYPYGC